MFKNIDEAVFWVTHRMGNNMGFDHFRKYIEQENQIVEKLKYIHVGGTNGKGSTCNFLCDILIEAGYQVGTFTSPHLIKHQDRICINHQLIDDESFLSICNERIDTWIKYDLNMFEVDFDIMTHYFFNEKVDFVILEVGLGGRLDCTNVIKNSLASVIVTIGLDHMDRLGNTLSEIAYEKAGIIKENGLVILGEQNVETNQVLKSVAKEKEATCFDIEEIKIKAENKLSFTYREYEFSLATNAIYQCHNAACAVETLLQLKERKIVNISDENIVAGLNKSKWSGRFETVSENPHIIIDGAHNEHGVKALVKSINKMNKKIVVVFAALKDKDSHTMVKMLHEASYKMIVTEFDFYRATKADNLKYFNDILVIKDWKQAIEEAVQLSDSGVVVVCGSLYFISEVRNKIVT